MDTTNIPNKFVAKTSVGSFQVNISNRDYITIGSRHACVQIAYKYKTNTANLDWLQTEQGGCEVSEKKISAEETVVMTDLGFTILRQLYPSVHPIINLRDSSKFACKLPDNNTVSISSMKSHLLRYGKTYYQMRFNAHLLYPESESAYHSFVKARNSATYFDKTFDFHNDDLNKALSPILKQSTNWGEFFTKMYDTYGRNSCALMHSWYLDVYGMLAKNPIHSDWTIDLNTRPMIEYTITSRNHSKNYTRKSYVYNPYDFGGGYFPSLLSYGSILQNTSHTSRTKKRH